MIPVDFFPVQLNNTLPLLTILKMENFQNYKNIHFSSYYRNYFKCSLIIGAKYR